MRDLYAVKFLESIVPAIEVDVPFAGRRFVIYQPGTSTFYEGIIQKSPLHNGPTGLTQKRFFFEEMGIEGLMFDVIGYVFPVRSDDKNVDLFRDAFAEARADLSKYVR